MQLKEKSCEACHGGSKALAKTECTALMAQLHDDWQLIDQNTKLERRFRFKGFAKAVSHANVAAFLGDREGHHPDIQFGWGYCHIIFTTHAIGGLSENDFICAAKLDEIVES